MLTLKPKLRFTIGTKLVTLVAILLMASVASVVAIATRIFIEDDTSLIQQTNLDSATALASQMREVFQSLNEKMRVLGSVLLYSPPGESRQKVLEQFFAKDPDFLAVFVHTTSPEPRLLAKAVSPSWAETEQAPSQKAEGALTQDHDFSFSGIAAGEIQLSVLNLSGSGEDPIIAIGVPFIRSDSDPRHFTHTLTALVRQSRFAKAFSQSDVTTSFLVDRTGRLLAHPEAARVAARESVASLGIVKEFLKGKAGNGQTRYPDARGVMKLGAFRVVGFAGLGVVTEVPEAKALQPAEVVRKRAVFLGITILSIAFLLGYLYSGSLTRPIRALVEATQRIAAGDFRVQLKAKGRDEIAHLSSTFNEMAKGLEERDRVKATFAKFHNKEIADKLMSGEVKLGGERKQATVFFSDVRGFTALSESMQPEQVVEMLNEYMTRMVAVIRAHGGVVDKYVGDAIMALWGVPISTPEDATHAIRACLAMREELSRLNELRISRGQPVLKIGMGVNTGPLIAGNIGSNEKMEYTVIGDAVNLASRIESMTKEYGTDLLISRQVKEQIDGQFIFEECESARVKGKSSAIELFKVLGYYDESRRPVVIQTPYSSYASEKSDKAVHDATPHPPEITRPFLGSDSTLINIKPVSLIPTPPPFRSKKSA